MKTVLVTGHDGYIGSILCPLLATSGYRVRGYDSHFFHDCLMGEKIPDIDSRRCDIRDIGPQDLEGIDAVIHLAALSNDPIGNLNNTWTEDINNQASIHLARLAKDAGVERFLFSSSCIMYGASEAEVVNEDSPLDPRTIYARSKVESERAISDMAEPGFSPVFVRNGTVYGLSPRMRLDTVFNDLMASAVTTGKVVVYSDGKPWRPVMHIKDLVRTFLQYLEAPVDKIHNQAFNNGAEELNRQIIELAEIACQTVSGAELVVESQSGADQRTYKADFTKFATTFPDFRFEWNAESGAQELLAAYRAVNLSNEDRCGYKFVRLRGLNRLLKNGQLDGALRWQ
ncbi:MAG TPA: SDR family oxidoreductase [Rhodospirillales bacterium]|nr:SDR family oxidoreductase [Rhodospirillales bacterium]